MQLATICHCQLRCLPTRTLKSINPITHSHLSLNSSHGSVGDMMEASAITKQKLSILSLTIQGNSFYGSVGVMMEAAAITE